MKNILNIHILSGNIFIDLVISLFSQNKGKYYYHSEVLALHLKRNLNNFVSIPLV